MAASKARQIPASATAYVLPSACFPSDSGAPFSFRAKAITGTRTNRARVFVCLQDFWVPKILHAFIQR